MKEDYLVIAAILLGALFLMKKASAGTPTNPASSYGMPYIGSNGSIMTADTQFIYDGSKWWRKGADGYVEIPGQ